MAYLAVALHDDFRSTLASIGATVAGVARTSGIDFDPMSEDGLHMTFFFLGDACQRKKRAEFCQLRDEIAASAAKLQFRGSFVPQELAPFPPGKQNLLVLTLAEPYGMQAWHARTGECAASCLGADVSRNPSPWIAHITLGKFGRAASDKDHQVDVARAIQSVVASLAAGGVAQSLKDSPHPVIRGGLELRAAPGTANGIDWESVGGPVPPR